ncbi:glutathione S-transferase [Methylobacterium sp. Leaf456]|uniref:glutathione S-transferase family protein n=1 Tax=Methylobacterium sp. Leaf456 TaxID=1736382 RepID=UPI0006F889BB|nr:glutathione S-transferase [Methylobacterium sp. Leaf456]KQT49207.1 glutathione S-transferase [Methylobacterium sp. Leaf456]
MTARTLYYAPGACSLAVHIALEEIGAPYETARLDLAKGDQRAPEFLSVNERGRVPALYEDGWVLTEVSAILRHLARAHPEAGLMPEELRHVAIADEWLGWLATAHGVAYAQVRRPERYAADETAFAAIRAKGADTFGDLCTMTEVRLSNGGWAVEGHYSIVDPYLLVFWLWARGPAIGFVMDAMFPAWTAHARAMAARPAARAVLEREGLTPPV